ncbi:MAG: NAD(P)/FAD-dependent oxidoreductase [Curvibacter sp.]|nr:NAD(P)/FAD-dependent oxidoreductase [Curvibacter sp.]
MPLVDPLLDQAALQTLRWIGPAPDNWVSEHAGIDHNVTLIGAGHSGSALAFALKRAGIGKVAVLDAAQAETEVGIWQHRARMQQLRTPKNLVGPELGLPALGFQAWYEARYGEPAYASLERIPRLEWPRYLSWFREITGLQVRYRTRLLDIQPVAATALRPAHLRLELEVEGHRRFETTRKLVLGNGVAGSGAAQVPDLLRALPKELWSHTSELIPFESLRHRRVAVLGGAASAFDAAATALEHGAAEVRLFVRRPQLASVPVLRARGYPGAYDHYPQLPDAVRWSQALRYVLAGSTAPVDSIQRVLSHPQFHLHLASPWDSVEASGTGLRAVVRGEHFDLDHVIAGTGFVADLALKPELASLAPLAARWSDRYTPPPHEAHAGLASHPYLGLGNELQARVPGQAGWLHDIHVFNPGGFVSTGLPLGDVPSLRRDVPRVVQHISRSLFERDWPLHEQRFQAPVPADFDPALYAASVWHSPTLEATEA